MEIARGYAFDQLLQLIDSAQMRFQPEQSLSNCRASANSMSSDNHEWALQEYLLGLVEVRLDPLM